MTIRGSENAPSHARGRRLALLAVAACAALGAGMRPSPATPLTIERVSFLQGCWEQVSERQTVEEQWTAPRGGVMMSVGRTVRDGRLLDFEFVVLREQDGVLEYEAHPSKQEPAVFKARTATDIRVVFENPEHDFPKVVGYERTGPDTLLAWIEGPRRGGNRRMDFPYKRVPCPGGAP